MSKTEISTIFKTLLIRPIKYEGWVDQSKIEVLF
jgi:hypothetical protein